MPEETTARAAEQPGDVARGRRRRFRMPRRGILWGAVGGAAFTIGYLANSFFYCQAQFGCTISAFWLVGFTVVGMGIGALWGWSAGKFMRFMYRVTRVD